MRLKSLHITGYKSFAKKVDLVFKTPITGIVGPNGSGKSNVVEAFRFVLGEQSLRSMRGKKGEDMIFNGGRDSAKSNRASVRIIFDNSLYEIQGNYTRLFNSHAFDEVSIERAVNRDGSNEYYINGNSVRLRDIIELLAEANIGSSGHHIISQGEADRLLSSSNKDRKEMIEEALGLKLYQYRKEESEKRLSKASEHMKEVESIRRELAPHIRFLKKQIEKIEKAREIRGLLTDIYKEYFAYEKLFLESELSRIEQEVKEPTEELTVLAQKLESTKAIIQSHKTDTAFTEELYDIENRLQETRNKKQDISRLIGKSEGEIEYINKVIDKKKKEFESKDTHDVSVSFFEIKKIIEKIKTTIKDISGGLYSSKEELSQMSQDLINTCNQYVEKYSNNNVQSFDTSEEYAEIERIEKNIQIQQVEIQKYIDIEKDLLVKYNEVKEKIESYKHNNVEAEKDLIKIMSRQHELQARLDTLAAQKNAYFERNNEYERDLIEASALIGLEAIRFETLSVDTVFDKQAQNDRKYKVEKYKIRLEELGGAGDDAVVKEYEEVTARDTFLIQELEDLQNSMKDLEIIIGEIKLQIDALFTNGIDKINTQFSSFFKQMFGGGDARLIMTEEKKRKRKSDEDIDEAAVLEEIEVEKEIGIDVFISLPHKKLKGLSMLSGGERALTSIALLFAMSQVNPPPFIILDETDAALDEANSRRYGDMIELLSRHSELILVTHNRETMSRAGVLYGVTMAGKGYSELLSIGFDEASVHAK